MAQRERKKEDFYLLLWCEFQNMPLGEKKAGAGEHMPYLLCKKGCYKRL